MKREYETAKNAKMFIVLSGECYLAVEGEQKSQTILADHLAFCSFVSAGEPVSAK